MADEKAPEGTAASEDAYQKELAQMVKGVAEEAASKPDDKKAEEAEEREGTLAESLEEAEEGDSDEEDEEEGEGEEKPESEEEKGKYSKAFRKLQKEEAQLQAFKASVIEEKKATEKLRTELDGRERELAAFVKALRADPFETLIQAKLLNEDDAEYISKQLYYRSKAAQADPKNRAEADRLKRDHALRMEAEENRQRLARIEAERAEERQRAEQQQSLVAYERKFESVLDSYKSKTPLLAQALAADAADTKAELYAIANEMSLAKKAFADPIAVIFEWNKRTKKSLARFKAAQQSTPAAAKAAPNKPNPHPAAEKKGPTDGKNASSTGQPEFDEASYWKELNTMLKGG